MRTRKTCSVEGCTTGAKSGGVCRAHGAPATVKKLCTHDGCQNRVKTHGVCWRHGAKQFSKHPPKTSQTWGPRTSTLEKQQSQEQLNSPNQSLASRIRHQQLEIRNLLRSHRDDLPPRNRMILQQQLVALQQAAANADNNSNSADGGGGEGEDSSLGIGNTSHDDVC